MKEKKKNKVGSYEMVRRGNSWEYERMTCSSIMKLGNLRTLIIVCILANVNCLRFLFSLYYFHYMRTFQQILLMLSVKTFAYTATRQQRLSLALFLFVLYPHVLHLSLPIEIINIYTKLFICICFWYIIY